MLSKGCSLLAVVSCPLPGDIQTQKYLLDLTKIQVRGQESELHDMHLLLLVKVWMVQADKQSREDEYIRDVSKAVALSWQRDVGHSPEELEKIVGEVGALSFVEIRHFTFTLL